MVLCAVDSANGDLAVARQELEDWFDSAMDRVSGQYRRRTQWVVALIALATTLLINVDTLRIATAFYKSPALRDAAVAMAGRITSAQAPPARTSTDTNTVTQPAPSGPIRPNAALDSLYALQLPVGWIGEPRKNFFRDPLTTIIGWLVTAFAVSLGGGRAAGHTIVVTPVMTGAGGATIGEPREIPHEWNVGEPRGGVV
jgi:hypothetical protein